MWSRRTVWTSSHGCLRTACRWCCSAPPYSRARLYLEDGRDLDIARDSEEWAAWLVDVFKASLRVCTGLVACVCEDQTRNYRWGAGPALLMADLHRAGVNLRRPCIYHRVGIPGGGSLDWLRGDTEFIVCATRPGRLPWSDNTASGSPPKWGPGGAMSYRSVNGERKNATNGIEKGKLQTRRKSDGVRARDGIYKPPAISNLGNVISCKVGGGQLGSPLAHENEAPFPESLCEVFIRSFCPPSGVCLDPFAGSGTTLAVAVRLGRKALGCDLRESQVQLTTRRMATVEPDLFELPKEESK